jgi:glycosyltransferase involved in cell wall biosynthesis
MKVLICVYRDDERAGGSVRVAEVLANGLSARGVEIHVAIAYGVPGRLGAQFGAQAHFIQAARRGEIAAWWRYRKLVRKLRPDVIHYVDSVGWMVLAGAWMAPKRVMHQHFRPDVGPDGASRFAGIRWLSGTADHVIAISAGAGRVLVNKCGVASSRVSVVYNAVDPDYLRSDKPALDSLARSDPRERILGMAVRIVNDKGIGDAFSLLSLLPPHFSLAVAGDGPAKGDLVARAIELGLEHRVRWLGSVRNIADFYAGIDYYLFMSWYEGFGLSVAEAMLCNIPVVGLLGDGEIAEPEYPLVNAANSILVTRSVPGAFALEASENVICELAEAIQEVELDFVSRGQMTATARAWVEQRFSSMLHTKQVLEIYQRLLARTEVRGTL